MFTVIFYKEFLGDVVPENYLIDYKDYERLEKTDIAGYTFFDRSGYKGEWELMGLVKTEGAIQLTPIMLNIYPSDYTVRFSPDKSSNALFTINNVFSKLVCEGQIIALGCKTC